MSDGEALWRTNGKPGQTNIPNWKEEIRRAKYSQPDYSVIEQYGQDMARVVEKYKGNQVWLMFNGGKWISLY